MEVLLSGLTLEAKVNTALLCGRRVLVENTFVLNRSLCPKGQEDKGLGSFLLSLTPDIPRDWPILVAMVTALLPTT